MDMFCDFLAFSKVPITNIHYFAGRKFLLETKDKLLKSLSWMFCHQVDTARIIWEEEASAEKMPQPLSYG